MGFQYIIRPTSRSHISKTVSNSHIYSVPRKSLLHIGKYDMRYRSGATRNHQKLMYVCVCKCMFCANGPGHALVVAELPDLFADDCVLLLHRCTFLPRCVAILSATGLPPLVGYFIEGVTPGIALELSHRNGLLSLCPTCGFAPPSESSTTVEIPNALTCVCV